MEFAILVTRILAVMYILVGISGLVGDFEFKDFMKNLEKSPALTFFMGVMAVVIGMLILAKHNMWTSDWTVLVTFVGWAAVFKGAVYILFPKALLKASHKIAKHQNAWSLVVLVIGAVLAYLGFLA